MIRLNVFEYCQSCVEFSPRVVQRPEHLCTDNRSYFCGDTIVKCQYRFRCEAISNYLKEENNKSV